MVSKTRKQHQKIKAKLEANNGIMPAVVPSERKSIHLKKNRPNMKGKNKIRMGMESPDIYEGFEDKKGVLWKCQQCGKSSRVVGFCFECSAGVKLKEHSGVLMSREGLKASTKRTVKEKQSVAKKAPLESNKLSKKLRFKKKHQSK